VFAGEGAFRYLEYPAAGAELARRLISTPITPGTDGLVRIPTPPGLGVDVDLTVVRQYLQPVRIEMSGELLVNADRID
jgi:L-alanine-DL-glutamate epimerase-like enolase superfamily enzyme